MKGKPIGDFERFAVEPGVNRLIDVEGGVADRDILRYRLRGIAINLPVAEIHARALAKSVIAVDTRDVLAVLKPQRVFELDQRTHAGRGAGGGERHRRVDLGYEKDAEVNLEPVGKGVLGVRKDGRVQNKTKQQRTTPTHVPAIHSDPRRHTTR